MLKIGFTKHNSKLAEITYEFVINASYLLSARGFNQKRAYSNNTKATWEKTSQTIMKMAASEILKFLQMHQEQHYCWWIYMTTLIAVQLRWVYQNYFHVYSLKHYSDRSEREFAKLKYGPAETFLSFPVNSSQALTTEAYKFFVSRVFHY